MTHRRSFLFSTLGAGCALAARADQLFWTVDTTSGKVQGIGTTGIKEFKGIPYGAPTGGKNRYMPPQKPAAWTGVRYTPSSIRSNCAARIGRSAGDRIDDAGGCGARADEF